MHDDRESFSSARPVLAPAMVSLFQNRSEKGWPEQHFPLPNASNEATAINQERRPESFIQLAVPKTADGYRMS